MSMTERCLPCLSLCFIILLILSFLLGAPRVMDLEVEPQSLWHATFLNKLSLPETFKLSVSACSHFRAVIGAKCYLIQPLICCDIFLRICPFLMMFHHSCQTLFFEVIYLAQLSVSWNTIAFKNYSM